MYAVWLGKKDSEGNSIGVKPLDEFATVEEALECAAFIVKGLGASIIEGKNTLGLVGDKVLPCLMVHDLALPFAALVVGAQLTDTDTNDLLPVGASTETVTLVKAAEA